VLQNVNEKKNVDVSFLLEGVQQNFHDVGLLLHSLFGLKDGCNCVTKYAGLQHPLDKSWQAETSILAKLLHAAKSEQTVEAVVKAETARFATDFAFKSKVGQQVVVHYIEHGQGEANGNHD
jgi:hypothetical protein